MKKSLVPRASWAGCDKCWREGVPHLEEAAAFGGPCYIRFGYCDEKEVVGLRLRPPRRWWGKGRIDVAKDAAGRWVWIRHTREGRDANG